MSVPIRVGTRGSLLATTQSNAIAARLGALTGRPVELVHVQTLGDSHAGSISQIGGTGVFAAALREALLDGECDVAVHSLKDLPTEPLPGLTFITPEREDPHDALCAKGRLKFSGLETGARIGTGSPRRAAQLRVAKPGLEVIDIRGNVDTRLTRVFGPNADLDAVVLAAAGLNRIGRSDAISELLRPALMMPAPGQGALAVEARSADVRDGGPLAAAFAALDHRPTRLAVLAERALLSTLETGCSAPVGALGRFRSGELALAGVVASLDGNQVLRARESVAVDDFSGDPDLVATALGTRVAEALLEDGAAGICSRQAARPTFSHRPPLPREL